MKSIQKTNNMDKLSLAVAVIEEAKTATGIMEIPAIADVWVKRYQAITGKNDGSLRFEAEKVQFLKVFEENKDLEKASPFSKYTAFMDLCESDLSLRDGLGYVLSMDKNKTVMFLPGWKGRLEQINRRPSVKFVYDPEVVWDCDTFVMTKGMKKEIKEHIEGVKTPQSKIIRVYMVVDYVEQGPVVYEMTREQVLSTRDNYSPSYKAYVKTITNDANVKAGKKIGDRPIVYFQDSKTNQWKSFEGELPMPLSDEEQYFKKTLVKRVYQSTPKLEKEVRIDNTVRNRIADSGSELVSTEGVDADEQVNHSDNEFADYEEIGGDNVNTSTGEIENTDLDESDVEGETF